MVHLDPRYFSLPCPNFEHGVDTTQQSTSPLFERTKAVKSSLLKRSLIAGAVVATSVATFIPTISAASAATVIAVAGSDTTENVMKSIMEQVSTVDVPTYNVPVYSLNPFTVPADDFCPSVVYSPQGTTGLTAPNQVAPNGSGAGRNALRDFVASSKRYTAGAEVLSSSVEAYAVATPVKGCIDIARSSAYSSGSPAATKGQFYAFALDAVSWASPSSKAPSTLSISDLQKIYNCTYTNWNQVPGGSDGQIQRYLPQAASGTRAYFLSDVLMGAVTDFTAKTNCPAVKILDKNGLEFEENRGDRIPDADLETAILPYSAGQWAYQANNAANPSIDQRKSSTGVVTAIKGINNSAFGKTGSGDNVLNNTGHVAYNDIDGRYQLTDSGWANVDTTADAAGYPITDSNTVQESGKSKTAVDFPGVRLVYNVLHTDSPSYSTARDLVGFNNIDSGAKSTLCSGGFKTTISTFGFSPLTSTANGASNLAGSSCRRYLA